MPGLQFDFIMLINICLWLRRFGVMTSLILYHMYSRAIMDSCYSILFQDYLLQYLETKFWMANYLVRSLIFIHELEDKLLLN